VAVHQVTRGSVDVWIADLDEIQPLVSSLVDLISGEERARAMRLRSTQLRLRFITAHAIVRTILSSYVGRAADRIALETTAHGKPFLADASLAFNVSQSEGFVACAVAASGRVGIDIEMIRAVPDADSLAARYFAPAEASAYELVGEHDRPAAFFSVWTRKEAFVKALGGGEPCPLREFAVEIAPAVAEPRIVTTADDGRWWLRSFEPAPGFVGAVACDDCIDALRRFDVDEAFVRAALT
jgi:4'-phosphopantetheinyl transferase